MALTFVLDDEFTPLSEQVLREVASDGALVPCLWDIEVLNGLRSAERRGRLSRAALTTAIHGLSRLPIEPDGRPVDGVRITSVAREFSLSAYDAAYLALAMDTSLPLATLDTGLRVAAAQAGVPLVA
jgi:predicted nucleic acid-binding protein